MRSPARDMPTAWTAGRDKPVPYDPLFPARSAHLQIVEFMGNS